MSRASCPFAITDVTSLSGGRPFFLADDSIDWIERQMPGG